jgi:hypothetical protein
MGGAAVKKTILLVVLIVVIVGLLLAIGFLLGGKKLGFDIPALITEQSDISAHTVVKEVLPIGEYASLAYHYTSVVKDINARDIKGWTIPFTTRKYIFTYDGTMKLGIDGSKVRVEDSADPAAAEGTSSEAGTTGESAEPGKPVIRIVLPPIKILSHEVMDDSIEVFEQSQTIFNEIKLEDAFNVTADRKREMEEKVMAGTVVDEAKASLEQQFGNLLKGLPGVQDYDLEFVWEDQGTAVQ